MGNERQKSGRKSTLRWAESFRAADKTTQPNETLKDREGSPSLSRSTPAEFPRRVRKLTLYGLDFSEKDKRPASAPPLIRIQQVGTLSRSPSGPLAALVGFASQEELNAFLDGESSSDSDADGEGNTGTTNGF